MFYQHLTVNPLCKLHGIPFDNVFFQVLNSLDCEFCSAFGFLVFCSEFLGL